MQWLLLYCKLYVYPKAIVEILFVIFFNRCQSLLFDCNIQIDFFDHVLNYSLIIT